MRPRLLVLSITFAIACSSGTEPDLETCTGPVTMTATAGLTPTFAWSPRCAGGFLLVQRIGDNQNMWLVGVPPIQDQDTMLPNTLAPKIRYGTKPDGIRQNGPALPLVAGTAYGAYLEIHGPHAGVGILGTITFTP